MVNPVVAGANLFAQLVLSIPASVRALYFLVLTLCSIFFIIRVVVQMTG